MSKYTYPNEFPFTDGHQEQSIVENPNVHIFSASRSLLFKKKKNYKLEGLSTE